MSRRNAGKSRKSSQMTEEEGADNRHNMRFPEDMDDDVKEVNLKIQDTTLESLDSTRRMLALCEESKDAAISTLVMLDDQGEQLDRVEQGLDTINQDMKEAEEHLKGMEKCCGLCTLPWNKADDFEKNPQYANTWKKEDEGGVVSDQPRITVSDPTAMGPSGGYITKITNDAREDDMEENLQEVSGMIGNLRNMAIDMGTEVSNQNRQMDRINVKAEMDKDRIAVANQRATKIISKA